MKQLLDLFLTFARVGGLTFGGGYSILPILQKEIVENKNWATEEEIMDYYAIGQCTPGIISINTATFIGYKNKGIIGAILATFGVTLPSLIIISIITAFISNFTQLQLVKDAFAGIRICICVLILNVVIKLLKTSVIDKGTLLIFILVLLFSIFTNISPVIFVIVAALMGIVIKSYKFRGDTK